MSRVVQQKNLKTGRKGSQMKNAFTNIRTAVAVATTTVRGDIAMGMGRIDGADTGRGS
jgi:hypothetical protein